MDAYHQRLALHRAVEANDELLVSTLLSNNVDINYTDFYGYTALHLAVSGRRLSIMNLLLAKNPNVNIKSILGDTPLLLAAHIGYFDAVEEKDRGADVRDQDDDGRTTLDCNSFGERDREVVKLLLLHGAYIDAQDWQGRTALHLAVIAYDFSKKDEFISDLLEWGASMFIEDMDGIKPIDLASKQKITKTFLVHMYKLQFLGLIDDTAKYNQRCIDYWDWDTLWLVIDIMEEANKMKTFRLRVYELFSKLFDPAFLEDREVRSSLESFLQSTSVIDEFPIYSSFIRVMFIKCEQRLSLLNTAQNLYLFCMNTPFSNEIIRMILSFLDDDDLRSVITAGQETA